MQHLERITLNPQVMGGKPCIRGLRVTVGTVIGLMAAGYSIEAILEAYPYLEREDILAALAFAAWRSEEYEVNVATAWKLLLTWTLAHSGFHIYKNMGSRWATSQQSVSLMHLIQWFFNGQRKIKRLFLPMI